MTITIIMPTRFERDYITEAFQSIYNQTRKPDEIVIVKGHNQAAQMNQAVNSSTSDAFIYLADDDLLNPDFIARHEEVMNNTDADIVCSSLQEIGLRNGVHEFWDKPFMCSLIKRSLWKKVGGFDAWPDGQSLVDGQFFHKCLKVGAKISRITEPLWKYRVHEGQTEITMEQTEELHRRLKE